MNNQNNTNFNGQRLKRGPQAVFATARTNLLIASIFTVVNIVLIIVQANLTFVFSMYTPQVTAAIASALTEYGYGIDALPYVGLTILIIGLSFLFWGLSKKYNGLIIAALVLYSADTIFMFMDMVEIDKFIIDILFHAWVMYYLISGTAAYAKLAKMRKMTGAHDPGFQNQYQQNAQNPYQQGAYQQNVYQQNTYQMNQQNSYQQNAYQMNPQSNGQSYQNSNASSSQYQYGYAQQGENGLNKQQQANFSSQGFYDSGATDDKTHDYSSHVVDINAPRDEQE